MLYEVITLDELAVPSIDRDAASAAFMREGMRSLATRRVADGLDKLEAAGELFSAAGARPGTRPAPASAPVDAPADAPADRPPEGAANELV